MLLHQTSVVEVRDCKGQVSFASIVTKAKNVDATALGDKRRPSIRVEWWDAMILQKRNVFSVLRPLAIIRYMPELRTHALNPMEAYLQRTYNNQNRLDYDTFVQLVRSLIETGEIQTVRSRMVSDKIAQLLARFELACEQYFQWSLFKGRVSVLVLMTEAQRLARG
jgi:hypothetical protein